MELARERVDVAGGGGAGEATARIIMPTIGPSRGDNIDAIVSTLLGGVDAMGCLGAKRIQPKTPIQQNEEDLQTLQRYQNEIIECHKQELALKQEENADQGADMGQDPPGYNTVMGIQPQGGAFGTNQTLTGTHPGPIPSAPGMVPPPVAGQQVADMPSAPSAPPPTYDEVMAQDAQELQREQHELLNDILDQQREETDPERLEELYMQHRELIGQMEQLHAAGFHYAGDIPPVPQYGGPGVQPAPVREVMDVGIAVNS
ncbi:hypothetical protein MAR_006532 [Mya arenaria]|uniref:Bindin n=1 Tax=Mya arenaria TaxID=6604 RepID=A0ABY7DAF5_MYAAR|nr:hypothetical protein MAR_006532 [Mya arenaria]